MAAEAAAVVRGVFGHPLQMRMMHECMDFMIAETRPSACETSRQTLISL